MSVLIKVVPVALVGVVLLAVMLTESSPTTAELPGREYVSVTVMMNSDFASGRGPSAAPCMVLFNLDQPGPVSQVRLEDMRRVASEIYSLYAGDSSNYDDPAMTEFIRHLHNDSYRPHARKAVPMALAGGQRLYVSDIMLHRDKFSPDSEMKNVAMVKVTGESKGRIYHIPWSDSILPDVSEIRYLGSEY